MGTTIERTIEQIGEVLAPDFQEAAPGLDADTCGDLARETAIQVLVELGLISGEAKQRIDSKIGGKGAAYAIPDDALKLMPSLIKAVGKLLTGNFFAPVPELIGILYRYRTLRVELTADEAAVMRTLRRAANDNRGPLTLAQIGEGLARNRNQSRPEPRQRARRPGRQRATESECREARQEERFHRACARSGRALGDRERLDAPPGRRVLESQLPTRRPRDQHGRLAAPQPTRDRVRRRILRARQARSLARWTSHSWSG